MQTPKFQFSYWGLLATQLVMLIAAPALQGSAAAKLATDVIFGLLLLFAVWSVSHSRRATLSAGGIALVSFAGISMINLGHSNAALEAPTYWLAAGLLGYVAAVILRDVVRAPRVTSQTIVGAMCVYVLLGVAWGFLYSSVDALDPASFANALPGDGTARFVYFSMVTLTTLGYGDVTPLSSVARGLAVVEAIAGQVFLAVLMARLVGLHLTHAALPDSRSTTND